MSHFTVMVIGPNPEDQLAPFDESITLEIPIIVGELTEEEKNKVIDYYKRNENIDLPFDELYELKGHDWNNNCYEKHDGVWNQVSYYNPKSKWDWYKLGGRWQGFLKLKEGTEGTIGEKSWGMEHHNKPNHCDATIKGNIDIEGMRNDAAIKAGELYDKVMEFIKDLPPTTKWSDFIKRIETGEITWDIASALYQEQPRVNALRNKEAIAKLGYFVDVDDFNVTKEEYVQDAKNSALSTFAILKDGKWYEKGKMGWWAIVTDEVEQNEWDEQVTKMIDELPDDTLISIYDCHI